PVVPRDLDCTSFDEPVDTDAGNVAKAGDAWELDSLVPRRVDDRARDWMLARQLDCPGKAQRLRARRAVQRRNAHHFHAPFGNGPRLVEDDGPDPPRLLEHLGTPDQNAELRPAPGADHERRRRRETKRARAGDDQYGDGGGEGIADVARDCKPA